MKFLLPLLLLVSTLVRSQCLTATNGVYPNYNFAPACNGVSEIITTCGFASEYSVVNVTAGTTYTFSSNIANDILTISNSAGTVSYTTGTGTVIWTSTVTGSIRFYTHTAGCGSQFTCRARMVTCGIIAPTTSNQNCAVSTPICNDATFSGNSSGYGTQELNSINKGCLSVEHQASWYTFQAITSGSVALTIITNVDYDFAIWGPNIGCASLGTPIRCSYSAFTGNTGLGNGATDNSESTFGDKWVSVLPVTAGQSYIMLIDNFTANSTSFTLDWTMLGGATLNCTGVLPIELVQWDVYATNTYNRLSWMTATEINCDQYMIERSADAINWTKIYDTKGAGTTTTEQSYVYDDYTYKKNSYNYYRLIERDFDGTYRKYNIIVADNKSNYDKKAVRYCDVLGRDIVTDYYEGIYIVFYEDGSVEKRCCILRK